ncbi:MAG TPA: phosphoglucosamine mutase, partial [Phycisphaerae bacterium]|nr:phosphoglucosamine mutase [Phycisphaerae bacterium]
HGYRVESGGGIVLTASHNPSQWNGIKFLTPEGHAPPASMANEILDILRSESFALVDFSKVGKLSADSSTNDVHVNRVLKIVDVEAIRAKRFKVVVDSVNGAGQPVAKHLLDALGCEVTYLNPETTGLFAHTPEPLEENLGELCGFAKSADVDVAFAQDPDADRLVVVDENGRYIGEEYTLVLAARRVLELTPGATCANLSTSRMLDDLAAQIGGGSCVHRSAVGEANVVETMKANNCIVGGEGNGGIIDPRVVYVRDSVVGMALVLDLLAATGQPLSTLVADLPRYELVKTKTECAKDKISRVLANVQSTFAKEKLSTIDGVRIDWPEGWVHVRGSNTEPIMRIIGEASDQETAMELVQRIQRIVDSTD